MYRLRKVIALVIGCGIILASWIIGCQQSNQPKGAEVSLVDRISKYIPGTKASSKSIGQKSSVARNKKLPKEVGKDEDYSKMVLIPDTEEFDMGTTDSIAQQIAKSYEVLFWEDEQPQHQVELDAYYIGKYEVSNSQYKKFLDMTGYKEPKYWKYPKFRRPNQPVIGVTWNDASAYCDWLSQQTGAKYRLPTEAEWERAAAGKFGYIYPWGNNFDKSRLNFDSNMGRPTSVAGYPFGATGSGIMNMAGNVSEWVSDWYAADYYAKSPPENPTGPGINTLEENPEKVYRGGAWNDWQFKNLGVRCAKRYHAPPETKLSGLGFRWARDAK